MALQIHQTGYSKTFIDAALTQSDFSLEKLIVPPEPSIIEVMFNRAAEWRSSVRPQEPSFHQVTSTPHVITPRMQTDDQVTAIRSVYSPRSEPRSIQTNPILAISRVRHQRPVVIDERKTIVECLWQLVKDTRERAPGGDFNLQNLWLHVQDDGPSKFHKTFFGVRFCEKMETLDSDKAIRDEMDDQGLDIKPLRAKQAKWKPLAVACRQFDDSSHTYRKYVVLCAVCPGNEAARVKRRLAAPSDPLRGYLEKACDLFLHTLHSDLPTERMYIESYKKYEPPTDDEIFGALVSRNPHAQIPIL